MDILAQFETIDSIIFDVDGVLTNSNLLVTEEGELLRTMHTRDGYALKHAIEHGLKVIIITGGSSIGVVKRLKGLGIHQIYYGIKDKLSVLLSLVENGHIELEKTAYMGDDIPDLSCMKKVAIACAPADAASEILSIAHYVSPINGGEGAVRDVLEKILRIKDCWH